MGVLRLLRLLRPLGALGVLTLLRMLTQLTLLTMLRLLKMLRRWGVLRVPCERCLARKKTAIMTLLTVVPVAPRCSAVCVRGT